MSLSTWCWTSTQGGIWRNFRGTQSLVFYTNVSAEGLSKRLLTMSSVMAPIAIFVRLKMDTALKGRKYSTASVLRDPRDTVEWVNDNWKSLLTRLYAGDEEVPHKKLLKRHSKRGHKKLGNKVTKRNSFLSKPLQGKYDTYSETKPDDGEHSVHKHHVHYCRAR